jgi:hypothetical protein
MMIIEEFDKLLSGARKRLPFKKLIVDVFKEDSLKCGIIIRGVQGTIRPKSFDHFEVGSYDEMDHHVLNLRSKVESNEQLKIFGFLVEFVLLELSKNGQPKTSEILLSIKKWLEFSNSRKRRISRSKQIGLFGELSFLESLMSDMSEFNHLEGWTGPNGSPIDFSFGESFGVEVKSRLQPFKDWIAISSTSQLDNSLPALHLVVFDFVPTDVGVNLREKVESMKANFSTLDEQFAFLDALLKVGYDHFLYYDDLVRVKLYDTFSLDARVDHFPILARSSDMRIDHVKYSINILGQERLSLEFTHSMIRSRLKRN